ncbi:MAG: hypothetical protein ACRD2D_14260, partial [Terriglobales bacterium]
MRVLALCLLAALTLPASLIGAGPSAASPYAPLPLAPGRGPQVPNPALRDSISAFIQGHHRTWTQQFSSLLAIPNLAIDTPNIERNAAAIEKLYQAQGVKTQLLRLPGAPPVVFGTYDSPAA